MSLDTRTAQKRPNEKIGTREYAVGTVQVTLVLGVALASRFELERGFTVVAALILLGFLGHSQLPLHARLPFFLSLSATAMGLLLRTEGLADELRAALIMAGGELGLSDDASLPAGKTR